MAYLAMWKGLLIASGLAGVLFGASLLSKGGEAIITDEEASEAVAVASQVPLTIEEELQAAINNTRGYGHRVVKLVPYSAEISHPRSAPKVQREAANRARYDRFFESDEIYLIVKCTTNSKGYASERSLSAVVPHSAAYWFEKDFETGSGSHFASDICSGDRSTSLRSNDVGFSILNQ